MLIAKATAENGFKEIRKMTAASKSIFGAEMSTVLLPAIRPHSPVKIPFLATLLVRIPIRAKLIVLFSFLDIAQYFIRFICFLKLLFRFFIARIFIRVIF